MSHQIWVILWITAENWSRASRVAHIPHLSLLLRHPFLPVSSSPSVSSSHDLLRNVCLQTSAAVCMWGKRSSAPAGHSADFSSCKHGVILWTNCGSQLLFFFFSQGRVFLCVVAWQEHHTGLQEVVWHSGWTDMEQQWWRRGSRSGNSDLSFLTTGRDASLSTSFFFFFTFTFPPFLAFKSLFS